MTVQQPDTAAIRERHRVYRTQSRNSVEAWLDETCWADGRRWPCEVVQLADALDAARAENERLIGELGRWERHNDEVNALLGLAEHELASATECVESLAALASEALQAVERSEAHRDYHYGRFIKGLRERNAVLHRAERAEAERDRLVGALRHEWEANHSERCGMTGCSGGAGCSWSVPEALAGTGGQGE